MVKVTPQKNSIGLLRATLNQVRKLPGRPWTWGAVGVIGSAATVYSVAKDGTVRGMRDARQAQGSFYKKLYDNTNSSEGYSHLLEDVKGTTRGVFFDHWLVPAVTMVKHLTKSIGISVVQNIDTIAASVATVGALFMKKHPNAQKVVGTLGAGYLLLKGGYTFMRDVMGFGKINT